MHTTEIIAIFRDFAFFMWINHFTIVDVFPVIVDLKLLSYLIHPYVRAEKKS